MQAPFDLYSWRRFWCPREETVNLGDGGYLLDPESKYGKPLNPHVVPYEDLRPTRCLVLLGEPGIGKTHALNLIRQSIDNEIEASGDRALWLDLNSYSNEQALQSDLFHGETVQQWINGSLRLHLYLDSLDECQMSIQTVSAILQREFKKLPMDRLVLRIRCRTAEWPSGLEQELRQTLGDEEVRVFELVPLRRQDVELAASANNLDSASFLAAIAEREVVPLAIKPITLEFLIECFRRDGHLPTTRKELYEQGCLRLCEEANINRRDAGFIGQYSAKQRLAAASRIAALTIFGGYHAISTGAIVSRSPGILPISGTTGGVVDEGGDRAEASESLMREVLRSGLFSGRASDTLGWAHQTYAEFLSAWFLINQGVTVEQAVGLVMHTGGMGGRVVPQLRETAAWLATMNSEIFLYILERDAEVLLRSDVATAEEGDRKLLAGRLLSLYDAEDLLDTKGDHCQWFYKLAHADLDAQVLPYIQDKTKGLVVRRAAIDIVEACKRETLQQVLADTALDETEDYEVREQAAHAVLMVADSQAKSRLKPLAIGRHDDDPNDELKGCALQAVWPGQLTVDELFANLTPPKRPSLFGMYKMFAFELSRDLPQAAAPRGLRWIENSDRRGIDLDAFPRLRGAILLLAWNTLGDPVVLETFADTATRLLKGHHSIFPSRGIGESEPAMEIGEDKKQQLLAAIIAHLDSLEENPWWLAHSRLVGRSDVPWLIQQALNSPDQARRRIWVELAHWFFWPDNSEAAEAVLKGAVACGLIAEQFRRWIEPVRLGSHDAEEQRRSYEKHEAQLRQQDERPLLDPPPAQRIERLLEAFEAGNLSAWWQLNMEMTLEPDSTHYGSELESDLTKLPGWLSADTTTRTRLIRAAEQYVIRADPSDQEWLGTDTLHRPACAGYRALRLLQSERPDLLEVLSTDVWKRWAAIIVRHPAVSPSAEKHPHQQLVQFAYRADAARLLEVLGIMVRKEAGGSSVVFITWKVDECWDARISELLLTIAQEPGTSAPCVGDFVAKLVHRGFSPAIDWAKSLIMDPLPTEPSSRERTVFGACALIQGSPAAAWDVVWPAMQSDEDWGRDVVEKIAHGHREMGPFLAQNLNESQLGDLFIWLARQYPHSGDPRHEGAHQVGARESIAWFRDSLVEALKNHGTVDSCRTLERVARECPDVEYLKWTVAAAWENTRSKTWQPLTPEAILKLAENREARVIQSGDQLLATVIESLERLQQKLQGETPMAPFLWDRRNNGIWRPKDENSLSDFVKQHLDDDLKARGIVANREVEIRRGTGGAPGENTDIHVDAITTDRSRPSDRITAIIETKGCWNERLLQDLEDQLVERYLKDNRCSSGLYLVGWFNCPQWDKGDYRRGRCQQYDLETLRRQLDEEASRLSIGGLMLKALILDVHLR